MDWKKILIYLTTLVWKYRVSMTQDRGGSNSKESACYVGDLGLIPGLGRSLEKGMAAHSSTLAWRTPWTEEPGGVQSMGSQRIIHSLVTNTCNFYLFIWLRQVWVVAWGIFVESFGISHCDTQILYLWPLGSVVAHGVSCSVAGSILVPRPGTEPTHPWHCKADS